MKGERGEEEREGEEGESNSHTCRDFPRPIQ